MIPLNENRKRKTTDKQTVKQHNHCSQNIICLYFDGDFLVFKSDYVL